MTRYEPRNLDAMRRLIVGFPDDMRVEAGPNVPDLVATVKTVAEFHSFACGHQRGLGPPTRP